MYLKYKGDRNYAHGSDIYNVMQSLAESSCEASFISTISFRAFARNQCAVVFDKPEQALIAQGKIFRDGVEEQFWLVESDTPITERYPFDEDAIAAHSTIIIEERQISLSQRGLFSPIEEVIAMTKLLNYRIEPDVSGKWVFGQLNVKGPLPKHGNLVIRMKSLLRGRFSINEIIVDDEIIGTIRFIVGSPLT
ncbi:hypothetical protein [Aestuariirhabdus haliotis]|uniref:hypothetical protein n=1 Tax=Aestuariirhabdus haliotis TaxID=2918751 RepID=UPI0020BD6A57|nr:hypothetical protein [Aestuariirhabdus haliotis]MCL6419718.1 hypothetical protein [Aestuariirhabdus haliotis]